MQVIIAVMLLASCDRSGRYIADKSEHTVFPRSTVFLSQPEFSKLVYYELDADRQELVTAGIAYEAWSDERFVINSTLTLRYRYRYDPALLEWRRIYHPVALGLDVELPPSAAHLRAVLAFTKILERAWTTSMTAVTAAIQQSGTGNLPAIEVFEFDHTIGELTTKDIRQRGKVVSLDFYEKDFYLKEFRPHPTARTALIPRVGKSERFFSPRTKYSLAEGESQVFIGAH